MGEAFEDCSINYRICTLHSQTAVPNITANFFDFEASGSVPLNQTQLTTLVRGTFACLDKLITSTLVN